MAETAPRAKPKGSSGTWLTEHSWNGSLASQRFISRRNARRLPGGLSAAAPRGAPPRPAPLGQPGGAGLAGHPLAGSVPATAFCQRRASAGGSAAFVSP